MGKDIDSHVKDKTCSVSGPARYMYILLGVLFFGLGVVGTVLPLLPTTPLVLLAAICFGKSSRRLHTWFLSTRFYRRNVESFVQQRSMTIKSKVVFLTAITAFMGISFAMLHMMSAPVATRVILAVVWLCHVLYFGFKVNTSG